MEVNKRGPKEEYTNDELKLLALDIKLKYKSSKITPTLLQRETGIGRNTWSRRISEYLDELNRPIISHISLNPEEEISLPNIGFVLEKYKDDYNALVYELISFEQIFIDTYKELAILKDKEKKFNEVITKNEELASELSKQKHRANHFETLYNELAVSSSFLHLRENPKSKVYQFKKQPLKFEENVEQNLSFKNLDRFFPEIKSDEEMAKEKGQNTFEKLKNEFNL